MPQNTLQAMPGTPRSSRAVYPTFTQSGRDYSFSSTKINPSGLSVRFSGKCCSPGMNKV